MSSPVPELPYVWRKYPVSAAMAGLLVTFLVLFPKGGVKVGTIPITWGYLLLGISLPILAVVRLLGFPLRFRKLALIATATVVPFDILFLYSCRQNGIAFVGDAIATFVNFFVFPVAFLLVYPPFLSRVDGPRLSRLLRFCMLAAAIFGIILFVLSLFLALLYLKTRSLRLPILCHFLTDLGNMSVFVFMNLIAMA